MYFYTKQFNIYKLQQEEGSRDCSPVMSLKNHRESYSTEMSN
uniref:Uncharacterized protein n=1 Tax=Anguilla anguilla TaxID=7936 RepID=A0A0E9RLR9_ANGAN